MYIVHSLILLCFVTYSNHWCWSKIIFLCKCFAKNRQFKPRKDSLKRGSLSVFFKKKWANPGLFFVYFRSFQTQTLQRDSSSDRRSRRRAHWPLDHHHGPRKIIRFEWYLVPEHFIVCVGSVLSSWRRRRTDFNFRTVGLCSRFPWARGPWCTKRIHFRYIVTHCTRYLK